MNTGLRRLYGSIRGGNWEQALELFPLVVFDFSREQKPSSSFSSTPSPTSTNRSIAGNTSHERTGSVLSELMKLCRANGRNKEAVQVFSVALETGLHCCSEADKEGMESLQELRNTKESIAQVREQLRLSQQQHHPALSSSTKTLTSSSRRNNNDVALYNNMTTTRLPRHISTPPPVAPPLSVLTRSISGGDESAWSQSLRLLFLLRANSTPGRDSPALRVAVPPPNEPSTQRGGDSLEDNADAYCQIMASRILEAPTAKEKIEIVTRELSEICHGVGSVSHRIATKDGDDETGAQSSSSPLLPAYTLDFVRCLAAVALDHAVAYSHDEMGGSDDPPSCLLDASTSGNLAAFDNVFFTLVSKWGRKYTFASLESSNKSNVKSSRGGTFHRGYGGVTTGAPSPSATKQHILVPKEGGDGVVYSPSSMSASPPVTTSYLPPHLTAEERMEYLFGSLSASHSTKPPHTRTFVILDVDYILSPKFVKLIAEMAMSSPSSFSTGSKGTTPTTTHPRGGRDRRPVVPDVWSTSVYHNAELVVTFSTLMALLECAMTSPLAKERLAHLLAARTSYSPGNGGAGGVDNPEYAVVRRRFGSLVNMLPEDLQADLMGSTYTRTAPAPPTAQQQTRSPSGGVTILGLQEEIMLTQIAMSDDDVSSSSSAPPATNNSSDEHTALADVHQRTQRLVAVARVISNIVEEASSSSSAAKTSGGGFGRTPALSTTPKGAGTAVDTILRSIGLGHLSDDNAGMGDVFLGDEEGSSSAGSGNGSGGMVMDMSRERCNVLVGAIAGGSVARACQTKGVQIL